MSRAQEERPGVVVLEDGRCFEGVGFGAEQVQTGEIVFQTSMTGYQEIATDPSYAGQIVTLTTAHVGNYGTREPDSESGRIWALGLVVRRATRRRPVHWGAESGLDPWLAERGVPAVERVDTRALTRHLRGKGVMRAAIASGRGIEARDELMSAIEAEPSYGAICFCESTQSEKVCEAVLVGQGAHERVEFRAPGAAREGGAHVALVDFGVKRSIVAGLLRRGLRVTLVPYQRGAEAVRALRPDVVLLSNGPGDPVQVEREARDLFGLVGELPVFGICLGHQVLATGFGARTYKMPYGHRGPNQPVRTESGRVLVTSQNHGYAVDPGGLPRGVRVDETNLNDGTVGAIASERFQVRSVQYHPEAGPGPRDADSFFDEIARAARAGRR